MKTFLVFLYLLIPIWANAQTSSKIRLSPNANLANSYILLNALRTESKADSLLSWINEEKHVIITFKTDITGKIIDIYSYRDRNKYPLFTNKDQLLQILLKKNIRLCFPMEIIGDVTLKKEIRITKQYYKEMFKEKGFIYLGLKFFDGNIYTTNKKEYKYKNQLLTSEEYLELLCDKIKKRIVFYK